MAHCFEFFPNRHKFAVGFGHFFYFHLSLFFLKFQQPRKMAEITRDDIISYIQDNFQMKVTVQDLTRPTGIFVVNVCNLFLSGFGIQQTDQPSFDAQIRCQPSEFEVQRETQLMINVFSRVRMIVEQVNFHVLLVDFVRPTPKRIHALLIALCQSHARYIHINVSYFVCS